MTRAKAIAAWDLRREGVCLFAPDLWGVLSFTLLQRTREPGIRMALG